MFGLTYTVLWVLIVVQGGVIIALIRELSELRAHVGKGVAVAGDQPIPIGSRAPRFTATDIVSTKSVSSRELSRSRPVHLFLSTECKLCSRIGASLSALRGDALERLAVYCVGHEAECRPRLVSLASVVPSFLVARKEVSRFRFTGFPAMATFDSEGKIMDIRYPTDATAIGQYLGQIVLGGGEQRVPAIPAEPVSAVVEDNTHARAVADSGLPGRLS